LVPMHTEDKQAEEEEEEEEEEERALSPIK
jgi:hypothetical protein